jgi:hypothetical protein
LKEEAHSFSIEQAAGSGDDQNTGNDAAHFISRSSASIPQLVSSAAVRIPFALAKAGTPSFVDDTAGDDTVDCGGDVDTASYDTGDDVNAHCEAKFMAHEVELRITVILGSSFGAPVGRLIGVIRAGT